MTPPIIAPLFSSAGFLSLGGPLFDNDDGTDDGLLVIVEYVGIYE